MEEKDNKYDNLIQKIDRLTEERNLLAITNKELIERIPRNEYLLTENKRLKDEIEQLKIENANLLKFCEKSFTFGTTENKEYSIFNSVRKDFADKLKAKAYENDYGGECIDIDDVDTALMEYYNKGEENERENNDNQ